MRSIFNAPVNRRSFALGGLAALAAAGLPASAPAAATSHRKLLIVFNPGGWDPTRVFVPAFGGDIAMEPAAERATAGGIVYVDHAARPAVRSFMDANHADTLVLNGVMVRSIAHEICTMIAMTGTTSGLTADWPAIIADDQRDGFTLPHLVLDGPSFPGDLGVAVTRTGVNGQLEALLSGQVHQWSDSPVLGPSRVSEGIVDRYLARRAQARALSPRSALEGRLTSDLAAATERLSALKDLRYTMDFAAPTGLAEQGRVAAEALSLGISRCVTVAHGGAGANGTGWDSHADNDNVQSPLWESLFDGLVALMSTLRSTPGTGGGTLADETLVVVLSEMGRTPLLNDLNGKDHWPYTSAMLVGPGITGDRVVGELDDSFYGRPVDPDSGDVTSSAQTLSAEALGATLLLWAGVDPAEHVEGVEPLRGVLA